MEYYAEVKVMGGCIWRRLFQWADHVRESVGGSFP